MKKAIISGYITDVTEQSEGIYRFGIRMRHKNTTAYMPVTVFGEYEWIDLLTKSMQVMVIGNLSFYKDKNNCIRYGVVADKITVLDVPSDYENLDVIGETFYTENFVVENASGNNKATKKKKPSKGVKRVEEIDLNK